MNRQQTRAQKAQGSRAWRSGIKTVHQHAAGLLEIIIVQPAEMLELLIGSLCGDPRATAIARAASAAVGGIMSAATSSDPKLCLTCPRELRDTNCTVVLAVPHRADPTTAMGSAICPRCAATDDLIGKASVALRGIWPSLRPVSVTHPDGGRA
jgi:hypothetical protein